MKWLLVVFVLLVVAVVGVAYYQGWFHVSTDNTDHHPSVKIEVNEDKFKEDKKKVEGLGDKAKDDAAPTEKVKDQAPRP